MTQITDLQIICIPTETQDEINGQSSYSDLLEYMRENDDYVTYDLGRYFEDQNDDNLGMHWSFLVNKKTGEIVNGQYNIDIEQPVKESPFTELRNDHEDEGTVYIDAWTSHDDDAQGIVIATIKNELITYLDDRAKTDKKAQEFINETLYEIIRGERKLND